MINSKDQYNKILEQGFGYHGTDCNGIESIINCGYIECNYFGERGFYLSDDFWDAINHGQYVLVIPISKADHLVFDEINDGVFFWGRKKINGAGITITSLPLGEDKRVFDDINKHYENNI